MTSSDHDGEDQVALAIDRVRPDAPGHQPPGQEQPAPRRQLPLPQAPQPGEKPHGHGQVGTRVEERMSRMTSRRTTPA